MPVMHTCMRHMWQTTSVTVHGSPVDQFAVPNAMCFPPTHRIAVCMQIRAAKLKPEPAPTPTTAETLGIYQLGETLSILLLRLRMTRRCESVKAFHLRTCPQDHTSRGSPACCLAVPTSPGSLQRPRKGTSERRPARICQPLSTAKL